MPKKRSNGEGTLRLRADGRWESAIMDGFRMDGKPHMKYFYGKTQKDVKEKVRAWEAERASGIDIAQEYTFSQWSDIWFEGHKRVEWISLVIPLISGISSRKQSLRSPVCEY